MSPEAFVERRLAIKTYAEQEALLKDAVDQENEYRGLFARHRESWEVPEVLDPLLGLVDVFANVAAFHSLPRYPEDQFPRCFESKDPLPPGTPSVVPNLRDFETSWDVFCESQLRFLDWNNVFAAGGAVAGCLTPVPAKYQDENWAEARKKRRTFFHDIGLPGSDVDLFLYGLNAEQAEQKLVHIYEAVQAANPHEVICFRSAHAVTLVSQYPFRHVQVVLRLYNSPAEVLMGFDVDSCACGFDGRRVVTCMRTSIAFSRQANVVDMSRRSPSYEMRLAKYAERGFEVVVPGLTRDRVDPFIYEKRFDQVQGLSRLLLLERLRTPEARFQYRMEQRLKNAKPFEKYKIQSELRRGLADKHSLARMEAGFTGVSSGAELSNYSTVFLPWGPAWFAKKVKRVMQKKDHALNSVEFRPGGRVVKSTRKYKIHVCACGSMPDVIADPFPNDPAIPATVDPKSLAQCVRGPVSWLVDNPGRQQIGSFHPITEGDWTSGAFLSAETEELVIRCAADDAPGIEALLSLQGDELLERRDFLGRTALHVAVQAHSPRACAAILSHSARGPELLAARLPDGRNALHLAAMGGFLDVVELLLAARKVIQAPEASSADTIELLDIDGADWELKLSPLQYAVVLGHATVVERLLAEGASAKKVAVHKDKNKSLSLLAFCAAFARDARIMERAAQILSMLFAAGASTAQVDLEHKTIWHQLVEDPKSDDVLELFLKVDPNKAKTIDVLDKKGHSPLYSATSSGNHAAVELLLAHGANPELDEDAYATELRRVQGGKEPQRGLFGGQNTSEDAKRMPIIHAAQSVDVRMLQIYLKHRPAMANTALRVPSFPTRSLLDLTREVLQRDVKSIENRAKQFAEIEKYTSIAEEALAKQDDGSYTRQMWQWSLMRLKEMRRDVEKEEEHNDSDEEGSPEQKLTRAERLAAQVEAAERLLVEHGGQPHPKEEGADEAAAVHDPFGFGFYGRFNADTPKQLTEPFVNFCEPVLQQGGRHMNMAYCNMKRLPKGEQSAALRLFEAVHRGDAEAVRSEAAAVNFAIVDAAGASLLGVAVARGDVTCVRVIFEVARRQYQPAKKEAPPEAPDGADDVAGQLRRINNLDLAAGASVTKDGGPSPDDMRRQLEALEKGVEAGEEPVDRRSKVPPSALLFMPSPTLRSSIPSWSRFEGLVVDEQKPKGDGPLRLNAIELAVLREDVGMVKELLDCCDLGSAVAGAAAEGEPCVEDDAEEEDEEGGEEQGDGDDDDDGEDVSGDGEVEKDQEGEATQLTKRDIVKRLFTEPNNMLNMKLLSIVVVVDNEEIFLTLGGLAEHYGLPLATMISWYKDTTKDDTPPMLHWVDKHLLHFALAAHSDKIVSLILTGAAGEVMLGWLKAALQSKDPEAPVRKVRLKHGSDFHLSFRHWLVSILGGDTPVNTVAARLFGPSSVDSAGQTALFYAPASAVAHLAANGIDLDHRAHACGQTALITAAFSGNVEKVAALLAAGCNVVACTHGRKWNALHASMLGAADTGFRASAEKPDERWEKALCIAKALLEAAGPEGARMLLEAHDTRDASYAEHTPLMLAAQKCAPEAVMRLLADAMRAEGLKRLDSRCGTALHLSASAVSEQAPGPAPSAAVGGVAVLLEAGKRAQVPALSAAAEDARGTTPLEAAANASASIWDPKGSSGGMRTAYGFGRFNHQVPLAKWRKEGAGKVSQAREATPARQCYKLLEEAVDRGVPGHRTTVGFEAVQQAAGKATAKAEDTANAARRFGASTGPDESLVRTDESQHMNLDARWPTIVG